MLRGLPFIVQLPSEFQRFLFEFSPSIENRLPSPAPDVFRCQIIQAFMVSPGVIVDHKLVDLLLKITRQVIVFQQNAVFQRAVSALNLALRHRVIGFAAGVAEPVFFQPVLQCH